MVAAPAGRGAMKPGRTLIVGARQAPVLDAAGRSKPAAATASANPMTNVFRSPRPPRLAAPLSDDDRAPAMTSLSSEGEPQARARKTRRDACAPSTVTRACGRARIAFARSACWRDSRCRRHGAGRHAPRRRRPEKTSASVLSRSAGRIRLAMIATLCFGASDPAVAVVLPRIPNVGPSPGTRHRCPRM